MKVYLSERQKTLVQDSPDFARFLFLEFLEGLLAKRYKGTKTSKEICVEAIAKEQLLTSEQFYDNLRAHNYFEIDSSII